MIDNSKEYILCAAIWFPDEPTPIHHTANKIGLVLCGHRHPHIIGQWNQLNPARRFPTINSKQGFLTSKNYFVERTEALQIAFYAEQTTKQTGQLFSEDLY
jgi:hypothetical protein